jgi:hypothetical protein
VSIFDFDDPTKSAEDKMSDALALGCFVLLAAIVVVSAIVWGVLS